MWTKFSLSCATDFTPLAITIPVTFWSMATDPVDEELARAHTGLSGGENGSSSEWIEGRGKSESTLKSEPSSELSPCLRTWERA